MDLANPDNGDTLLHACARKENEKACLFLVENGANVNAINNQGESTLHIGLFINLFLLILLNFFKFCFSISQRTEVVSFKFTGKEC